MHWILHTTQFPMYILEGIDQCFLTKAANLAGKPRYASARKFCIGMVSDTVHRFLLNTAQHHKQPCLFILNKALGKLPSLRIFRAGFITDRSTALVIGKLPCRHVLCFRHRYRIFAGCSRRTYFGRVQKRKCKTLYR